MQEGAVAVLETIGDAETVQSIRMVLRRGGDLQVKGVYAAMKVVSLIDRKEQGGAGAGGGEDDASSSTTP